MVKSTKWLRCRANAGQFSNEFAVSGMDFAGKEFSLFVDKNNVFAAQQTDREADAFVAVTVIDQEGDYVLVRLPGPTFENGQTVTVCRAELEDNPSRQQTCLMILSNTELHRALDDGRLGIEPEPAPRTPNLQGGSCPFSTHSVDLRLGNEIVVPESGQFSYNLLRTGRIAELIQTHSRTHTISQQQPFHLTPNTFVLGKTLEHVSLPIQDEADRSLAARIEGKSSRARLALLVHFTAPTVHPGFSGTLTLEIINLGPADILLFPGMPIAQLIVEEVRGIPDFNNPSGFQGQSTASGL